MAYTIQDKPIDYSPTGTPLIYTVISDNAVNDNFKYVCEIYDEDTNFLGELKSVPQPTSGYGKFDISNILHTTLETSVDFQTTGSVVSNSDNHKDFTVRFGEEYLVSGSFTRTLDIQNDTQTYFNGTPYWNEFLELRENNNRYLQSGSVDSLPLTARRKVEGVEGTKQWLYYLTTDYTLLRLLEVEDTDSNETVFINLPTGLRNNIDGSSVGFRCDKEYLEENTLLTSLKNWRVRTTDINETPTSEWIYFTDLGCEKWDLYSLYYINRWGGIDSFSFNGESNIEVQTERKSFQNNTTPMSLNGTIQYNNTTHSEKDYSVQQTDIIRLKSTWLSYYQYVSVVDLQASQRVWMEDKDGVVIPVRIDSDSVTIEQPNNKVLMVSVDVRYKQPVKRK